MICQQCQAQLMEESRFCPQCGIPVPEPQVEAAEKVETFDFDTSGEALGYISLQQAALLARRLARETDEIYKERLSWGEVVWTELRSEAVGEDYYRIVLQFRRPARGILEEQTGEEEFIFDVTGVLQDRQVLLWPEGLSAGEGEVDTTAMRQPEVSALQPAEPPSIAEALTSPPDFPHAGPTERRSEASPNGEEGGAADTTEVELGTSTTYQTLLQCTQCKTEYSPGQLFCSACGTVISNVSPPSIKPAPSIRSDDRTMISFFGAIRLGFKRYFDFKGRSTRAEFWWWLLFVALASIPSAAIADFGGGVFQLVTLIPSLALGVRRLHDINKSGWWVLMWLISWLIIPAVVLLIWAARQGDKETNKYGPATANSLA